MPLSYQTQPAQPSHHGRISKEKKGGEASLTDDSISRQGAMNLAYSPLSICAGIFVLVQSPHWRHVSATTFGIFLFFTSSGLVRNWAKKPADTCHAIWQWNGQTPNKFKVPHRQRRWCQTVKESEGWREEAVTHLGCLQRRTVSRGGQMPGPGRCRASEGSQGVRWCHPMRPVPRGGCTCCSHAYAWGAYRRPLVLAESQDLVFSLHRF